MSDMPTTILAIYGEFVRRPYYVIVHSQISSTHERYDRYLQGNNLTELLTAILTVLSAGRPWIMQKLCELDEIDRRTRPNRKRRYVAQSVEELYTPESAYLPSVEYRGCWLGTNADRRQVRQVVELACKAANVPYDTVRALPGFIAR